MKKYEPPDEFDGRPAPLTGCECRVCVWLRNRNPLPSRLVRPSDPEWDLVLRMSTRYRATCAVCFLDHSTW